MAYNEIIPDGFPSLYADQWRIQLQQLTSRLEQHINSEIIHGESKRFQRLAAVTAREITTRFGDTNPDDVDVEYRHLYVGFKDSAHRVDRREAMQLGAIGSPHSSILRLQLAAAKRDMDKTIIDGIRGSAATGKNGTTAVALPSTQQIAVDFGSSGTNNNLTFKKMLEISRLFGVNEVAGQDVDEVSPITLIITHNQVASLLRESQFTSSDYSEIRRLHTGQVVNLMGIAIRAVSPALLPYNDSTHVRSCYAYARNEVAFGIAEQPQAWVDVLPTGRHDVQLRTEWGWGCTRLSEEGTIEIACDEDF